MKLFIALQKRINAVILLMRCFLGSHKGYYYNYIEILALKLGGLESLRRRIPTAADGSPLPWFPYSAIEFLETIDLKNKTIFEYGSGNSTLWWAKRAKKVTSVEVDKKWFDKICFSKPHNSEIFLQEQEDLFADEINKIGGGGGGIRYYYC